MSDRNDNLYDVFGRHFAISVSFSGQRKAVLAFRFLREANINVITNNELHQWFCQESIDRHTKCFFSQVRHAAKYEY